MKKTTEQFIQEMKSLRMTDQEKTDMRHILSVRAQTSSFSPATTMTFGTWLRRHAMASALAIVMIVAGATTVSAHRAEPGDLLYGFRLKVNDRVQTALVLDEDKKLEVELRQIERQLTDEEFAADLEFSIELDGEKDEEDAKKESRDTEDSRYDQDDLDLDDIKDIEKDILDAEADIHVDLEI